MAGKLNERVEHIATLLEAHISTYEKDKVDRKEERIRESEAQVSRCKAHRQDTQSLLDTRTYQRGMLALAGKLSVVGTGIGAVITYARKFWPHHGP